MSKVLVDSSVWISYFKDEESHPVLTDLIRKNQICTNDLILAELLPLLKVKKQNELISGLLALENIPLQINWEIIINYQFLNIKNGINKVGISDLIILDNVLSHDLILFTEDKHFFLMQDLINFRLFKDLPR